MHRKILKHWNAVLETKADAVALVDAESGDSLTFDEIDQAADLWLESYAGMKDSASQVWGLSVSHRIEWMTVFLAAIKVGAVLMPLDRSSGETSKAQAESHALSYLIDDHGVRSFAGGRSVSNCFLIKLTSGTTGAPKAMPFSETEMMADGEQIMRTMDFAGQDRNFAVIPLGHSYGLGNLVMPFFLSGVSIVLGSSPFPQVMIDELRRYPSTVLPIVPPLVKALAMVDAQSSRLPELRLVISAGSALKTEVAARFKELWGVPVHNFYGSSETGGISFDRIGKLSEQEGAVGMAMHGVQIRIGDDDSIQVRSQALSHAIYPDGVCILHDYGRLDESGVLHLMGRHSDIVKIGGRRLSLRELESALCAIDGLTDAYVSHRIGRSGETRCVALYSGSLSVPAVRAKLSQSLPEWKIPKFLRKVEEVAYTDRGKKDRDVMELQVDQLIGR